MDKGMGRFRGIFSFVLFLGTIVGSACDSLAGSSEGCGFIDLRSKVPLKVRNQGDISWCYAHTVADLLQYFSGLETQISAADIAIRYNKGLWPRFYRWINGSLVPETGFVRPAIQDALEMGYCPEEVFPSEHWTRISRVGEDVFQVEKKRLNAAISEILDLQRLIKARIFTASKEIPFYYEFPGVDQAAFFSILEENPRQEVLDGLRLKACEGKRKPYPEGFGPVSMYFRGPSMLEHIHEQLEQERPVSVDYFYGLLEDSGAIKRKLSELHTSLLMGQRYDVASGECQYLIKNSYGESCSGYDPHWECQAGYLWVGESALRRALVSYVVP